MNPAQVGDAAEGEIERPSGKIQSQSQDERADDVSHLQNSIHNI
jgi:hypothetical protein